MSGNIVNEALLNQLSPNHGDVGIETLERSSLDDLCVCQEVVVLIHEPTELPMLISPMKVFNEQLRRVLNGAL